MFLSMSLKVYFHSVRHQMFLEISSAGALCPNKHCCRRPRGFCPCIWSGVSLLTHQVQPWWCIPSLKRQFTVELPRNRQIQVQPKLEIRPPLKRPAAVLGLRAGLREIGRAYSMLITNLSEPLTSLRLGYRRTHAHDNASRGHELWCGDGLAECVHAALKRDILCWCCSSGT